MKRRKFFQAAAALPAVPVLLGQQPVAPNNAPRPGGPAPPMDATTPPAPFNRTPSEAVEAPKLQLSTPEAVAGTTPKFFSAPQFAALRKLSEIIMPPINGAPGALDASVAEFLDFLLSESPLERQQIYKAGLDALNAQAKKRFNKSFSELDSMQTTGLLVPLRQPWAYNPPTDPLARFLLAAKQDVRAATMNSREYSTASGGGSGSGRRGSGIGLYWSALD